MTRSLVHKVIWCKSIVIKLKIPIREIQPLKKRTFIAKLIPVDEVFEARKVIQKIKKTAEQPEYHWSLWKIKSRHVTFRKKHDIFATSDRDLGKTDIITELIQVIISLLNRQRKESWRILKLQRGRQEDAVQCVRQHSMETLTSLNMILNVLWKTTCVGFVSSHHRKRLM